MHSKYDNVHKNGMVYDFSICINIYIITSINFMLSYKNYKISSIVQLRFFGGQIGLMISSILRRQGFSKSYKEFDTSIGNHIA